MKKWKKVASQVKVKLYLGPLAGELAAELPFTLMHPKVVTYLIHIAVVQTANALCCEYCGADCHWDIVYGSAGTGAGEEKLNFWEEKF